MLIITGLSLADALGAGKAFSQAAYGVLGITVALCGGLVLANLPRIAKPELREALPGILIFGLVMVVVIAVYPWVSSLLLPALREYPLPNLILYLGAVFFCHYYMLTRFFRPLSPADFAFDEASAARYRLSQREREIAAWILQGRTSEQIGRALRISSKTVKNHVYRIYRKVGTRNRLQLLHRMRGTQAG